MLARLIAFSIDLTLVGLLITGLFIGLRVWLRRSNNLTKRLLAHPSHWESQNYLVNTAIDIRDRLARFLLRQPHHTDQFKIETMKEIDDIIDNMIAISNTASLTTLNGIVVKLHKDVQQILEFDKWGEAVETPLDRIRNRQESLKAALTAMKETDQAIRK